MKFTFDWKEYAGISRRAGADGVVLIKNDAGTLPLKEGTRAAVFGRTQFDYIKSGSGSGGLVNTPYVVNIYEGLKANGKVSLDETIAETYLAWLKDHPFDRGVGWANEPFSQVEMPLNEEEVRKSADRNDVAIAVLGRLAGEDKDNKAEEGSYLLRSDERDMLRILTSSYKKVIVLINSGNIIDMKWVKEYDPSAVLYIWQGGMEGGNITADILTGSVNPSGHLADTIARNIEDYPSTENFGDYNMNIYAEDIFVGYRYFETFAPEKVLYPFGYGLSYTTFEHSSTVSFDGDTVTVRTVVKNTGDVPGKDAVQVYYRAPYGKLAKPARELIRIGKTPVIYPGKTAETVLSFGVGDMASFDDGGYTGYEHAWVLEAGEYTIYEGQNVRDAIPAGSIVLSETVMTEKTSDALAPCTAFKRMSMDADGKPVMQDTPLRKKTPMEHVLEERNTLTELAYAGSQKHNLKEVKDGLISLDDFVAGLSDKEMIELTRGEGMCSPRVTPGTAAAFGGVTDTLNSYGIPAMCCSDGPSGIRMDVGTKATQGPNGVCLACTFDPVLVTETYEYVGRELRKNKIDALLGPGMNIHRSPLNGRNFEYFSEDPYLTGIMAASELKGMHLNKVTGTIKHFSCNNQEYGRHTSDSVVSARALREIYLKGFEMAVKEGDARCIMTTYGVLNGCHTASNFEQNGLVLRHDWGYRGLVMTDWWAYINEEGSESNRQNTPFMIRGENDIYMVTTSSEKNDNRDHSEEGLKEGVFTRAELQRNAKNICRVALGTVAFDRLMGETDECTETNGPKEELPEKYTELEVSVADHTDIDAGLLDISRDAVNMLNIRFEKRGIFILHMDVAAEGAELAQIPMVLSLNKVPKRVITKAGSEHDFTHEEFDLEAGINISTRLSIAFGQDGMKLKNMYIERKDADFTFK